MAPRTRRSPARRPDAAFIEAQITDSIDGHLRRIVSLAERQERRLAALAELCGDRDGDGAIQVDAVADEIRDRSTQVRRLAEIAAVVGRVA